MCLLKQHDCQAKQGHACLEVLKGLLDLLTRVHHKRPMLQADASNP